MIDGVALARALTEGTAAEVATLPMTIACLLSNTVKAARLGRRT